MFLGVTVPYGNASERTVRHRGIRLSLRRRQAIPERVHVEEPWPSCIAPHSSGHWALMGRVISCKMAGGWPRKEVISRKSDRGVQFRAALPRRRT